MFEEICLKIFYILEFVIIMKITFFAEIAGQGFISYCRKNIVDRQTKGQMDSTYRNNYMPLKNMLIGHQ